jgi:predicted nucleotidyltransferase component of viral defense system
MHSTNMSTPANNKQRFLLLSAEERKEILQTLGNKRGQSPAVLEKDVWVCWALGTLFATPGVFPMAFKGGTSLSKVYKAIDRFSEDIDVTIDYKSLLPDAEPFKVGISGSQLSKLTKSLRELVSKHTHEVVLPAFQSAIKHEFGSEAYEVTLSEDGENLSIAYHPIFQTAYITDQVVVEFGGRNAIVPSQPVTIHPYISDDVAELEFPSATLTVLAAERTFWEKVTLLHYECNLGEVDKLERKSRHWYDVYRLAKLEIGSKALKDLELLQDVVKHKTAFFNKKGANYQQCVECNVRLIPNDELRSALERDYKKMVREGMFSGEVPEFTVILDELRQLESRINSTKLPTEPPKADLAEAKVAP